LISNGFSFHRCQVTKFSFFILAKDLFHLYMSQEINHFTVLRKKSGILASIEYLHGQIQTS